MILRKKEYPKFSAMKSRIHQIIIVILSVIIQSCTTNPPEISQWRGPDRNGIYPDTGLLIEWPENGPELIWEYNELGREWTNNFPGHSDRRNHTCNEHYSHPVIHNSRLYIRHDSILRVYDIKEKVYF